MAVNVQASFKKDEREYNGLEGAREDFIESPLERRIIVATVEVTRIMRDVSDGGTETPTVRMVNVEVLGGEDALTARKLLDAAYHERTGQTAPPPTLFDEGSAPGQDAATHDGEPWDERDGDANAGDAPTPSADATDHPFRAPEVEADLDEVAVKRGRRK